MREVRGLRWVRRVEGRPKRIPLGRPRGVKREGVIYERAVAKWLGARAEHGVWLEFEDERGRGFAQPDLVIRGNGGFIVGEVKRTWRKEAERQVRGLYAPLLSLLLGERFVGGIIICKNVTPGTVGIVGTLGEALLVTRSGFFPVLHWTPAPVTKGKFALRALDSPKVLADSPPFGGPLG